MTFSWILQNIFCFPNPRYLLNQGNVCLYGKKCSSHCNHRHSNTERNAFLIHINSGVNPGMQFGPLRGSVMSSIAVRTVSVAGSLSTFSLRPKANYIRERKQMKHTSRLECEDSVLSEMLCEGLQGWKNHHLDFMAPAIFFKKCHDLVSQFCLYVGFTLHALFSIKPLLL